MTVTGLMHVKHAASVIKRSEKNMATSHECDKAWRDGYIDGYKSIRSTIPSVPTRPGSHPSGVDPVGYYYQKAYELGASKAKS